MTDIVIWLIVVGTALPYISNCRMAIVQGRRLRAHERWNKAFKGRNKK